MISPKKLQANRANARHSTGPKSPAGKARSAHNARRHGLAAPVRSDPVLAANIESLAQAIAGEEASTESVTLAREIAEAQIDLVRIEQVRVALLSAATSGSGHTTATNSDLPSTIAAIDRYERRTLSRRKTAIRRFDGAGLNKSHEDFRS